MAVNILLPFRIKISFCINFVNFRLQFSSFLSNEIPFMKIESVDLQLFYELIVNVFLNSLFSRLRGTQTSFLIKCWNFRPFSLNINVLVDKVLSVLTQVVLITFLFHYKSCLSSLILIIWFNSFELLYNFLINQFFCLCEWKFIFLLPFTFPKSFFITSEFCLNVDRNLWMREEREINELLFKLSFVFRRMKFEFSRICEPFITFIFVGSWIMKWNITFQFWLWLIG